MSVLNIRPQTRNEIICPFQGCPSVWFNRNCFEQPNGLILALTL